MLKEFQDPNIISENGVTYLTGSSLLAIKAKPLKIGNGDDKLFIVFPWQNDRCGNALKFEWIFNAEDDILKSFDLFVQNLDGHKRWHRFSLPTDRLHLDLKEHQLELPTGSYRYWIAANFLNGVILLGPTYFEVLASAPDTLTEDQRKDRLDYVELQCRLVENKLIQSAAQKTTRETILSAINEGRTLLKGFPLGVNIHFTGRGCSANCNMCNFPSLKLQQKVPEDFYRNLIESIQPNLENLVFVQTAGGEPLIYGELYELLKAAEHWPLLKMSICTNGLLLNERWAKKLTSACVNKISFSIDAATREVYEQIRNGSDWDRVMHGIDLIGRHRRGESPQIMINFIVLRYNYHQMADFVELAYRVKAREVNFQTPVRVIDPSLVGGSKEKLTKAEWTYQATTIRDPYISACVLRELTKAEKLADKYGLSIPECNVRRLILEKHPYLAGIEKIEDKALHKHLAKLIASEANGYFGAPEISLGREDFGEDPQRIRWNNEVPCRHLRVWFVNLERDCPREYEIFVKKVQPNGTECVVEDFLIDGKYAVFLDASYGEEEYFISKRSYFKLNRGKQAPSRSLWTSFEERKDLIPEYYYQSDIPHKISKYDSSLQDKFFCANPFFNLTLKPHAFSFCCYAQDKYLNMPLEVHDITAIWNSDPIREARYYMLTGQGREKVCRKNCPYYANGFRL